MKIRVAVLFVAGAIQFGVESASACEIVSRDALGNESIDEQKFSELIELVKASTGSEASTIARSCYEKAKHVLDFDHVDRFVTLYEGSEKRSLVEDFVDYQIRSGKIQSTVTSATSFVAKNGGTAELKKRIFSAAKEQMSSTDLQELLKGIEARTGDNMRQEYISSRLAGQKILKDSPTGVLIDDSEWEALVSLSSGFSDSLDGQKSFRNTILEIERLGLSAMELRHLFYIYGAMSDRKPNYLHGVDEVNAYRLDLTNLVFRFFEARRDRVPDELSEKWLRRYYRAMDSANMRMEFLKKSKVFFSKTQPSEALKSRQEAIWAQNKAARPQTPEEVNASLENFAVMAAIEAELHLREEVQQDNRIERIKQICEPEKNCSELLNRGSAIGPVSNLFHSLEIMDDGSVYCNAAPF